MIISIKKGASGSSSRGLIHYLAHSKLDPEKEGIERREFFSESENSLDVRNANRHLSIGNAKPKPEELLHIVVAPSKEEIQSVGNDLKSRKAALKAVVRETVARLEKEIKAKKLKWAAALHFNTDNPHAHLAVQKEFQNENGRTESLRINRQMLHYNEVSDGGEKKLHKGALILAAENKIEEIAQTRRREQEKTRDSKSEKVVKEKANFQTGNSKQFSSNQKPPFPNFSERRILAEEMLVAAEIIRREQNIENLIEHGDKKRFEIKNEQTGRTRHISLFDIERKSEIISRRKARIVHPENTEKRNELAAKTLRQELNKNLPVIQQIETIRLHVLGFENRHLAAARQKHTRLNNQKLLIEKKYERLKTAVPLPLFDADEIQQLQSEVIRQQNSKQTLLLENIRQSNAAELNRPSRRDQEVRELKATKIVSRLKTEAAEKRLLAFSANKDFTKVKIGDSVRSHHELKQQKEFDQTLDKIFDEETNPNKIKLTPAFSAFELAAAEDLALGAERENFYENSLAMQENWLREKLAKKTGNPSIEHENPAASDKKMRKNRLTVIKIIPQIHTETEAQAAREKIIGDFVLGRVEARNFLIQVNVVERQEILAKNERDKRFIKHRIADAKTGAERELSLRDVEPKKRYYLLDSILERVFETKEEKIRREAVRQASKNREKELTQNLKTAQTRASRLENQKAMLLEKFSAATHDIQPIFTPKEIAALDVRAARTMNEVEAARLENLIKEAEKQDRVGRIYDFLEETADKLELLAPSLTKKLESKISRQNDSLQRQQSISESREIYNQSTTSDPNIRANQQQVKSEKEAVKEKGRTR